MPVDAIVKSLPMSLGVALSPLPVAAMLVILMSKRAGSNAAAFLLGWISGILAIGLLVLLVPGLETARGDPTRLSGLIRILLGSALVGISVYEWLQRPAAGASIDTPRILKHLDNMGAVKSSLIGLLLVAVHPKNLMLNAAGAAAIDASLRDAGGQYVALAAFALVASAGVAVPAIAWLAMRHRITRVLGVWKAWLIRNNAALVAVLLLMVGALLISRGLRIVLA